MVDNTVAETIVVETVKAIEVPAVVAAVETVVVASVVAAVITKPVVEDEHMSFFEILAAAKAAKLSVEMSNDLNEQSSSMPVVLVVPKQFAEPIIPVAATIVPADVHLVYPVSLPENLAFKAW